ncbi:MAG: DNRLRE domain-containing protein [Candidatus Schekmanbacteria bacterium]|nr:DNRLRE domain-containing protein [Candidatus Schekmanbacteria bacterium]
MRARASRLFVVTGAVALAVGCAELPGGEDEAGVVRSVGSTCVVIDRNEGTVADAHVWQQKPDKNWGGSNSLTTSRGSVGDRQALLYFDTSAIPQDAVVESATLTLNVLLYGGAPVDVYRIKEPWSEGTVTWNSFGSNYDRTEIWTTLPGSSPTSADLTALVQEWVRFAGAGTPGFMNRGMLLNRVTGGSTVFASSECATSGTCGASDLQPRLEVCYSIGSPIELF